MINLKFLNEALENVSSDEFKVLYFIANTISLKKESRTRIYRELIAERLGWLDPKRPQYGLKKVSRVTNSLVEKGWLIKEEVFVSEQKSVIFYSLSKQKIDQKLSVSRQKSVPLNKNEKEEKKEKHAKIIKKEEVEEFATVCASTVDEEELPLPF